MRRAEGLERANPMRVEELRVGMRTLGKSGATSRRTLVAYFSWSGNTREVAVQIHGRVGGELFEIVSTDRYPSDYDETVRQAKRELDAKYLPKLRSEAEHLESCDLIFIGYPNWWGTVPRPVASFLSKCDSVGRTIAPFCTHEGTRLGRSVEDIAKLCPRSTVLEGLAIRGGDVKRSQDRLAEWLRVIGING